MNNTNQLLEQLYMTDTEREQHERDMQAKRKQFSDALNLVMTTAMGDTGGSRVCRDFLLSLYNGSAYPFDLNGFRNLDGKHWNACMTIMQTDCRPCPPKEIHHWWMNGHELFDTLIERRTRADRSKRRKRQSA